MREPRSVSLLSGIGITVHDGSRFGVLPAPLGVDRRNLVAKASNPAVHPPEEMRQVADYIRASRTLPALARDEIVPTSGQWIDLAELREAGGRFETKAEPPPLAAVLEALAHRGVRILPAEYADDALAYVNTGIASPVYEASDSEGSVIAGGKGQSAAAAQWSAAGEAIERLIACEGGNAAICTSATELRAANIFVPSLNVGARDAYTDDTWIDWVPASTLDGTSAALPAERAFYRYAPQSGVTAFQRQYTAGLAAGTSVEAAIWAAISELLERDAYWIVMRSRLACPSLDARTILGEASDLDRALTGMGLELTLKDISIDAPVHIVHAILRDISGRLPAFSHGLGSGFDLETAAIKAVVETVQSHAGLARRCLHNPQDVLFPRLLRPPDVAWSDPSICQTLAHLYEPAANLPYEHAVDRAVNPVEAVDMLERRDGPIVYAILGEFAGIKVVRAYSQSLILPDPGVEHIPARLRAWLAKAEISYPYEVPILT